MANTYSAKEYRVTMAPVNGGTEKKTVDVIACSPSLASWEANQQHKDWIATHCRCLRTIRTTYAS